MAQGGFNVCMDLSLGLDPVFLLELVHTTAGIDEFLLTSKVRVASGTNLNTKVWFEGTRFERVTANASYCRDVEVRMNALFH
jgi:hypothetical protein